MKLFFAILCALWAIFVFKTFHDAGEFKSLTPTGKCQKLTLPSDQLFVGLEDLSLCNTHNIIFVSADDRRSWLNWFHGFIPTKPTLKNGKIFVFDPRERNPKIQSLTLKNFKDEFHPHGISLYESKGKVLLFVVNHKSTGHAVEIFEYNHKDKSLKHRKTITHPLISTPNDILAIGEESFFITNDHGARTRPTLQLETFLQLPWSNVVYYSPKEQKVVASGIKYANGINMSPDGKQIFVASTIGKSVLVYSPDKTNNLTLVKSIPCDTGVDNIEVDQKTGDLYIGAHPKMLTFLMHVFFPNKKALSEVIRIKKADGYKNVERLVLSNGEDLSASSVAVHYNGKVFVGSVFDDGLLVCSV